MKILGLTGSIGMGKSATLMMFREAQIPVYDADQSVHALYDKGGAAVEPVEAAFPGVIQDGGIDRNLLRERVLGKPEEIKKLESIVHPLTGQMRDRFLEDCMQSGARLAVLDIPLLFESNAQSWFTAVAVVSAPYKIQRERVLARPGTDEAYFQNIRAKQVPDAIKRAKADFVINTALGFDYARAQVEAVLSALLEDGEGS